MIKYIGAVFVFAFPETFKVDLSEVSDDTEPTTKKQRTETVGDAEVANAKK